ncbi:MAG: glycosyltransferase [Planctomyces sp.]|nr:glycosyltransferase [Planctomyces sp.]
MSTPVPIAFCITDLDAGGAERALVRIATQLPREQWSPRVLCLGPRGVLADELEAAGVPATCLGARSLRDVGIFRRLVRELRMHPPRLLQTFLFHANVLGRLAAWRAGVPVVVSGVRVAEREQRWHLRLERLTRGFTTHTVCVSESVAEFAAREMKLPREQVSVIHNGVDFEHFANATPVDLSTLGIPEDATTLLFVGRLHRQKGVAELIEAITPLFRADARWRLLLVGEGPQEPELRDGIRERGLEPQVRLLGRRDDIPGLMKSASALVAPSLWEGLPNVVLEAMAAGLPVIATRCDGTAELIREEETGWLAEPGSAESFRGAIERWRLSAESAAEAVRKSQSIVQEQFAWRGCLEGYAALYCRLLRIPADS